MSLITKDSNHNLSHRNGIGVAEVQTDSGSEKSRVAPLATAASGKRIIPLPSDIHTLSAIGLSHMEVIRHLSKYIRSHRHGDMLAVSKCNMVLAEDLAAWCRLQNQQYHYCATSCVFGLIVK